MCLQNRTRSYAVASKIVSTSQALWGCHQPLKGRGFATEAPDLHGVNPPGIPAGYIRQRRTRDGTRAPDSTPLPAESDVKFRWRMAWTLSETMGPHYRRPAKMTDFSKLNLTPTTPWRPGMRRVGMVGRKQGTISMWDANGECHPICVLRLTNNFVFKTEEHDKYTRVWVSGGGGRFSDLVPQQQRMFEQAQVPVPAYFDSFKVHKEGVPPLRTMLRAIHFVPGQWIDVKGKTREHGFSGAMKRWGFSGGPASHGSTKFHRKIGAVSTRGLGTIKPGTRMAGHMGGVGRQAPCRVVRIDTELDLLYLKGDIPGNKGAWVTLQDAHLWRLSPEKNKHGVLGLPWPCGSAELQRRLGDVPKEITLLELGRKDPTVDFAI